MVKVETSLGAREGGFPRGGERQQIITQYADNTSYSLHGEEDPVCSLIQTLVTFRLSATGLVITRTSPQINGRSMIDNLGRPPWTNNLGIASAAEDEDSKFLGAPFGMSFDSKGIDKFLYDRTSAKLEFWCAFKLNQMRKSMIANSMLLSTPLFSLSVWKGSKHGITRIQGLIMNYLNRSTMQRTRIRLSKLHCCQPRNLGGGFLILSTWKTPPTPFLLSG